MTTTDTDTQVLTGDDIAALRVAESVTFHRAEGRDFIRCHVRNTMGERVWTAKEQRLFPVTEFNDRRREIPVTATVMGYGNGNSESVWHGDERAACFYMEHGAEYDKEWQTIAHLLRAGDELRLRWTADNNSETIREANLHIDQLSLTVVRKPRDLHFHVATTCTRNNTARTIRRNG